MVDPLSCTADASWMTDKQGDLRRQMTEELGKLHSCATSLSVPMIADHASLFARLKAGTENILVRHRAHWFFEFLDRAQSLRFSHWDLIKKKILNGRAEQKVPTRHDQPIWSREPAELEDEDPAKKLAAGQFTRCLFRMMSLSLYVEQGDSFDAAPGGDSKTASPDSKTESAAAPYGAAAALGALHRDTPTSNLSGFRSDAAGAAKAFGLAQGVN